MAHLYSGTLFVLAGTLLCPALAISNPLKLPYPGKLVFQSNRTGNYDIFVRDQNGVLTNVTNNPASDTFPVWSPDGKRIVFTSDRGGIDALYIMNADGTGVAPLVSDPAGPVNYASYSDDGKSVLFTGPRRKSRENIFMFDRATRLVTGPHGVPDERSQWGRLAQDGRTMAFMHYRKPGGTLEPGWFVTLVDLITRERTVVDHGCEPAFSPDGTKLAYVHFREETSRTDLYVYDIATAAKTRLTNIRGFPYAPRFTPDGKWIVYAMAPDKKHENQWDLYIMPFAPFSTSIRITNNEVADRSPDMCQAP